MIFVVEDIEILKSLLLGTVRKIQDLFHPVAGLLAFDGSFNFSSQINPIESHRTRCKAEYVGNYFQIIYKLRYFILFLMARAQLFFNFIGLY